MIKVLDKAALKMLAPEIEAAVQAVAAKHGVTLKYAGGTYGDRAVIKLEIGLTGEAAEGEQKRQFEQWCGLYGFNPEHYGAEFTVKHETFRLIGFNPSRDKYPLACIEVASGRAVSYGRLAIAHILKAYDEARAKADA
jgi:hypothetical protein